MLLEAIRDNPAFKRFAVEGVLFAQYTCPLQERAVAVWTHADHLIHVVSGRKTWRGPVESWTAEPGQTFFFRKGAYWLEQDFAKDFCALVFFIPDAFVRETLRELGSGLPPLPQNSAAAEPAIVLREDTALAGFLQSMAIYFAGDDEPPAALLRLKLRELITGLVTSRINRELAVCLRATASQSTPSISAVMEQSYCHNLSLEAFARMCHRSLSTFKRDFQRAYGTSPGRWLVARRLERARQLLQSTTLNVTEVMIECGFEDPSHFGKAYRRRYGRAPSNDRSAATM